MYVLSPLTLSTCVFLKKKPRYLFLAALGLCCCMLGFSHGSERGYSLLLCTGFSLWWLLVLWSTGSRHVGFSTCSTGAQQLWCLGPGAHGFQQLCHRGSVVVAHGLQFPTACRIFLDQDSNPCPLHWQADSSPLHHQGSSTCVFIIELYVYKQPIVGFCFYINLTICLLIGVFNIFEIIINMVGFKSPILVLVFCLSHLCFVSIQIFLPPLDMLNFFNHSILSSVFKYTSLWYILVAIVEQWFLNFTCVRNSWRSY